MYQHYQDHGLQICQECKFHALSSYPIFKLVYSAAKNANHNMGLNEADLFISKEESNPVNEDDA
jgi:ribosomal protein L22